jgi:PAS domain-containing protein
MMTRSVPAEPEGLVAAALEALQGPQDELLEALDRLPAAIYVTDHQGIITHYNQACIALAGRVPAIQRDRWCVTWKLYTTAGEFMPHEQCPMAVAIREKRMIRGQEAIAERPDGTRMTFIPYPTPIIGEDGQLIGAVNLLLDVTEQRQVESLRQSAAKCRRLSNTIGDRGTIETLRTMADEYDAQADLMDRSN